MKKQYVVLCSSLLTVVALEGIGGELPLQHEKNLEEAVTLYKSFDVVHEETSASIKGAGEALKGVAEGLKKVTASEAAGKQAQKTAKDWKKAGVKTKPPEGTLLFVGKDGAKTLALEKERRKELATELEKGVSSLAETTDKLKASTKTLMGLYAPEAKKPSDFQLYVGSSFYSREDVGEGDDHLLESPVPYFAIQWEYESAKKSGDCCSFLNFISSSETIFRLSFENKVAKKTDSKSEGDGGEDMAAAESGDGEGEASVSSDFNETLAEADAIGFMLKGLYGTDPGRTSGILDFYHTLELGGFLSVEERFGKDFQSEFFVGLGWRHEQGDYVFSLEAGYANQEVFKDEDRWLVKGGWKTKHLFGENNAWGMSVDALFNVAVDGKDEDEFGIRIALFQDVTGLFKGGADALLGKIK